MATDFSAMKRLTLEIENVKIHIDLHNGFSGITSEKSEPHSHKQFEFHHVLSGSVRFGSEKCEYVTNRNEAYIIAPNVLHSTTPLEEKTFKTSFCFSFSKIKRRSTFDLYDMLYSSFDSLGGISKIPIMPEHTFFLNEIYSLFYSKKALDRFKVRTYFTLLLTGIAEYTYPTQTPESALSENELPESDIRHLIAEEFIQTKFSSGITLSDLASTLHLSPKQTERIFRREFGQSFKEYLIKVRLANAKKYLTDTDLSVYEISEKVGYGTYNGFYTMFVNETGMRPTDFRLKYQNKTRPE